MLGLAISDRLESLRKEISTVRHVVLVFLGAGLNFSVGSGLIVTVYQSLFFPGSIPSATPFAILVIPSVYFLVGVLYSTSASLAFRPKRIVSTIYVQVLTSAFIPIFIAAIFIQRGSFDIGSFIYTLLLYWMFALILFLLTGLGQLPIVRYLVGLNGTKEDLQVADYSVSATPAELVALLKKPELAEALRLWRSETIGKNAHLFRTPVGVEYPVFVTVCPDPKNLDTSQLAVVAYQQGTLGISKGFGDDWFIMRVALLTKNMDWAKIKYQDAKNSTYALILAQLHALTVTESKLLSLRSLPPHLKAIGTGIALMVAFMSGLWRTGIIGNDLYETFWIFAGLAILFDFLPIIQFKRREGETA